MCQYMNAYYGQDGMSHPKYYYIQFADLHQLPQVYKESKNLVHAQLNFSRSIESADARVYRRSYAEHGNGFSFLKDLAEEDLLVLALVGIPIMPFRSTKLIPLIFDMLKRENMQ